MRKIKKVVSTGCFFLCLGGWVYSGQLKAADEGTQARDTLLNAAVAQAAAPGATSAAPDATPPAADATPSDTGTATAAPAASGAPAAGNVDAAPAPAAPAAAAPAAQSPAEPPALAQAATPDQAAPPAKAPDLSAPNLSIGVDGRVDSLNFQDLDINAALHFLADRAHRNIIVSKNVKGPVSVNLYNVSFTEALDALLKPNGFDYIEKGNFIYVYTDQELADIKKRDLKTVVKIYRLKYMNAQDASALLHPLLSAQGAITTTPAAISGLPSDISDTGAENYATDDTVVVSDYPTNIDEIGKALVQLDVRPKQVLVEATILNASMDDTNAMGIDLISLSGVNFSTLSSASLTNNANSSSTTSTTGTTGTSGSSTGTAINGPGGIVNNFLGTGPQANLSTDFSSHVPPGGLSVGFLSNNIALFMRALEETTDTTIVANPKILALNKQHGVVHIGQKLGYQTTSTSTTTTQETVQFLDVGTKLIFRPFITDDGYIRMEIHPEDSSGFIDTHGVPQTNTTEVTSNVMIKDGHTIVIGGLFNETTTAAKGQVPILGNIPVLGVPFRRTNDETQRQETIILITPHIINDDTSLYDESLKESEDVTRMQLGNRAELQPWGRDRIAHLWYNKAQEEAQKGNTEKAIMYCDWALNTNGRLLEAIKLREQLTGKKMDEAKGSSVADLVKNVLAGDAATTPNTGGSGNYPPPAPETQPATAPAGK